MYSSNFKPFAKLGTDFVISNATVDTTIVCDENFNWGKIQLI